MPKAKTLKPLRYLNRMIEAGEEFEVMPGTCAGPLRAGGRKS